MISFNFDYYEPDSIDEAVEAFKYLDSIGKQPLYYNGGTEIITFARRNSLHTGGVIDIKKIPECNVLVLNHDYIMIGSSVTLSQIADSNYYPLLGSVSREIADRTARNKITIGGNICGRIQFREAVLPLLISDCFVVTAGINGIKTYHLNNVFDGKLKLELGEFLVQIIVPAEYMSLPGINIKRRRQATVGYPLVSIAAVRRNEQIRFAISGITSFPFRAIEMEEEVNKQGIPKNIRIKNAINRIPYPVKDDLFGSAEYRKLLLQNALSEIIDILEVKNEDI
jgi:CO/xanthine dehydrogenase FAD-binding subunit